MTKPDEPSFERRSQQLEEIVQKLEKGELPLEDSLRLYEEGIRLSRLCHAKLEEAEGQIEVLMKDARGEPVQDAAGRPRTTSALARERRGRGVSEAATASDTAAAIAALRAARPRRRSSAALPPESAWPADDPPRRALQPVRRRQADPADAGAGRGRGGGRRRARSCCPSPAPWR